MKGTQRRAPCSIDRAGRGGWRVVVVVALCPPAPIRAAHPPGHPITTQPPPPPPRPRHSIDAPVSLNAVGCGCRPCLPIGTLLHNPGPAAPMPPCPACATSGRQAKGGPSACFDQWCVAASRPPTRPGAYPSHSKTLPSIDPRPNYPREKPCMAERPVDRARWVNTHDGGKPGGLGGWLTTQAASPGPIRIFGMTPMIRADPLVSFIARSFLGRGVLVEVSGRGSSFTPCSISRSTRWTLLRVSSFGWFYAQKSIYSLANTHTPKTG